MQARNKLSLTLANVLFGFNFILFKRMFDCGLPSEMLFFILTVINAIIFIPALTRREAYRFTPKELLIIIATAVVIIYGREYFLIKGAMLTSPIDGSTIATLSPIITLTLSSLIFKDHPHPIKKIGITLCFAGSIILFVDNLKFDVTRGNLYILIAAVATACNTVFLKPVLNNHSSHIVLGWSYLVGLVITTPFFMKYIDFSVILDLSREARIELTILSLFGTALPTMLLYFGVKNLTSMHTALFSYFQPLTAAVVGVVFYKLTFDIENLIALIAILLGIILLAISYHKYGFASTGLNNRAK